MMTKYFFVTLLINLGLIVTANAETQSNGSTSLSPPITAPKKKVIFIDYGHTVQKNFGAGCGAGYVPIGIAAMPKNKANFSKSTPINHKQYKFNFRTTEYPKCILWRYYWSEYKTFNPSWVTGFATPTLKCAPIDVAWQT